MKNLSCSTGLKCSHLKSWVLTSLQLVSFNAMCSFSFACIQFPQTIWCRFVSWFILLTGVEFWMLARMSIIDMTLNLCMSASLMFFYQAINDKEIKLIPLLVQQP